MSSTPDTTPSYEIFSRWTLQLTVEFLVLLTNSNPQWDLTNSKKKKNFFSSFFFFFFIVFSYNDYSVPWNYWNYFSPGQTNLEMLIATDHIVLGLCWVWGMRAFVSFRPTIYYVLFLFFIYSFIFQLFFFFRRKPFLAFLISNSYNSSWFSLLCVNYYPMTLTVSAENLLTE